MRYLAFAILLTAARGICQTAAPAFEAASVKASTEPGSYHWDATPGTLRMRGINLKQCIQAAYRVEDFQVEGGPGWTESDRYDIDGKASNPAKTDEIRLMLRTLLTERFHLQLENRPHRTEGYSMAVAAGGLKIKPDAAHGTPAIQVRSGWMNVTAFPMPGLAGALSNILGLPVSDDTGSGAWLSFSLEWTPDQNRAPGDAPAIVTSLAEALEAKTGLHLKRAKVAIPVCFIRHAEKPGEN